MVTIITLGVCCLFCLVFGFMCGYTNGYENGNLDACENFNIVNNNKAKENFIIEWTPEDVQKVAREKLSFMENCDVDEIIENPLTDEQVKEVFRLMDKYYDCEYGVTWDTIRCTLDDISLPDSELCRRKS